MPLINCPECGTEVSDKAAACPNCAHPINTALVQQQPMQVAPASAPAPSARDIGQEVANPIIEHERKKSSGGATGALLGALLGYGLMYQSCHMEWVEWNFVSTHFVSTPLVFFGMNIGYYLGKAIA